MEVTKQDLEAALFAAVGKSESYTGPEGLRYIRFEPGMIIACNGKILTIREVPHEGRKFKPFQVSIDDVKGAIKANAELWSQNGRSVTLKPGDDFMAAIGRKRIAKQDATYPDWQRVLVKKDKPNAKIACFDPEQMMRALKGMKDLERVKFRIWGEDGPVRIDGVTQDGRKVMSLVMPCFNVR